MCIRDSPHTDVHRSATGSPPVEAHLDRTHLQAAEPDKGSAAFVFVAGADAPKATEMNTLRSRQTARPQDEQHARVPHQGSPGQQDRTAPATADGRQEEDCLLYTSRCV